MTDDSAPAGTVTFMFTDIVGSSSLWEQHPPGMKTTLAMHDAILRRSVENNRGMIVKTTGDGVHAVFASAVDALSAALAAQQRLLAESWQDIQPQALRVRIGIHSGESEQRAGDYYGLVVNRAARIMSVSNGGQILVSASTAELCRDFLPAEVRLVDLGEHRLKDLVRPEHLYQLAHSSLPLEFPPLKSIDQYPNNLPVQVTSFIGRQAELAEAGQLVASSHLLTLTGSGGTGKTRLSIQLAAELLDEFSDGAWLVELAPLSDGALVLQSLADVLGLQEVPGTPLLRLVSDFLKGKSLLLILDNCEHLIDACARLADHLLRACPRLKIIASSREALGVPGEVSYRVPSLSLPDEIDPAPENVRQAEAAQLFIERATAANSRFTLTTANAAAVAQICRRLDGIPLALELAAARSRLFPPEQIAERLNDRFRLLTGGSRTALPRQQTLRAMIDWSYDLLSHDEKALLRQLSIFSGGWTFEAAEAVCSGLDALTLLDQLVSKSLVFMEDLEGQARYHLLETIRQYAREKLFDTREGSLLRDRHFIYFLLLSCEAEPNLRGDQAFEWFERLKLEEDNLRTAIEWGLDARPEETLQLIANLHFFQVWITYNVRQSLQWLMDLLHRLDPSPGTVPDSPSRLKALARGYMVASLLTMGQGNYPAGRKLLEQAAPLERLLNEPFYLSYILSLQGVFAITLGDAAQASQFSAEAIAVAGKIADQDRQPLIFILPLRAAIEERNGNNAEARRIREDIRRLVSQYAHPMFVSTYLGMGMESKERGELEEAQYYFSEGLKIAQRMKSSQMTLVMESELAHLTRERGQLELAKQAYRRLIRKWKERGMFAAVAHQLECFGQIAVRKNEPQRAARLYGAAEALRDQIHVNRNYSEEKEYLQALTALRTQVDTATYDAAWAEGRAMDIDRAIQYAVTEHTDPVIGGKETR